MKEIFGLFGKGLDKIIYFTACGGMSVVVLIMAFTSGDTLLRLLFGQAIVGVHELCEFMLTIMAFFGLAYTAVEKGHIAVDLVFHQFPPRVQRVLAFITGCFSFAIYSLISWQAIIYGFETQHNNVLSPTLTIPLFPFVFATGFGTALLSLTILREIISLFGNRDMVK